MIFSSKADLGLRDYELEELEEVLNPKEPNEFNSGSCFWMWPGVEGLQTCRYRVLLLGLPGSGAAFLRHVMPHGSVLVGSIYDPRIDYSQNTLHISDTINSGVFFYEIKENPDFLVCISSESRVERDNESTAYISALFSRFSFEEAIIFGDIPLGTISTKRNEQCPPMVKIDFCPGEPPSDPEPFAPHLEPLKLIRGSAAAAMTLSRICNVRSRLYLSPKLFPTQDSPQLEEILTYLPVLKSIPLSFKEFNKDYAGISRTPVHADNLYT